MIEAAFENVYGAPDVEIVGAYPRARQFSPLHPGADNLEDIATGTLNGLALAAPPGTLERRRTIALALRALRPGAQLIVLARKDKGGSRIGQDLKSLGCTFAESARRHHRICIASAPGDPAAIEAALEAGAARYVEALGLWSQPGVFSWDRIDPGSALLLAHLPALGGKGGDFGCGIGVLARAVLAAPAVTHLTLIDIDRRAIEMTRRNIEDPRAELLWADLRSSPGLAELDFVVMNPPFHDGGIEDRALGRYFIERAAQSLRAGGMCWLTANRHLPYEAALNRSFRRVTSVAAADGYKIYQAQK